jgi:acetylglutamate kinase
MGSYVDGNGSALMTTCSEVAVDLALASALSSEHALNVNVESMAVEIAANIQVGLFLLYTLDFLVVLCCKVV